jgi:hypothetical protein
MNGLQMGCNDSGRRLVIFATSHGMTAGETLFPQKYIHKATWKSPNDTQKSDRACFDRW